MIKINFVNSFIIVINNYDSILKINIDFDRETKKIIFCRENCNEKIEARKSIVKKINEKKNVLIDVDD